MRSQRPHNRISRHPYLSVGNYLFVLWIWWIGILFLPSAAIAQQDQWTGVKRIVAIGDVHGDYQQLVTLLRQAQLIDARNRWIGGTAHLVQLGDVPDRGAETRRSMDLLMGLEKEASYAGGYVHALIGNHEAMNVYGDLRYVPPEEFEAYRDRHSLRLRQEYYEKEVESIKQSFPPGERPQFDDVYKEDWEAKHPLGWFEQRLAFNSQGRYGKWILGHNAVIKINNILFLHGGISPKYATWSVADINATVRSELRNIEELEGGIVQDDDGPLWYRGLAQENETSLASHVDAVLENYGVRRIVVGHTVTPGTVIPRFHGKVLLADVGMTAVYGSRLACLILEDDVAYVLHRGVKIPIPSNSGPELLQYLQRTAALDPQPSPLQALIEQMENYQAAPASR
jgi:Calcineurin-like phosphoesterase